MHPEPSEPSEPSDDLLNPLSPLSPLNLLNPHETTKPCRGPGFQATYFE